MSIKSEAQKKCVQRYITKHYDRHVLTMPKGEKEGIRAAAESAGQSVNAYCMEAIRQRIERERAAPT